MRSAQHHVVVFGATSFVGQILCRFLLDRHGSSDGLRWAIAGRSREKLSRLRGELGARAAQLPVIIADSGDEDALRRLCASTSVVVSTVGPYALYGSLLVKVCAETGTDYCDLTGETQWISRMLKQHEETARKTGARLVHCCGFDSVPSDLGVHLLQQQSRTRLGIPCARVRLGVRALRGGFSGGTVASMAEAVREAVRDPAVRRLMANPYALCPDEGARGVPQPQVTSPQFDADAGSWVAPFIMSAINTRIVHRSNALSGGSYGPGFTYDETVLTGPGPGGYARAAGMSAFAGSAVIALGIPPTRWLLQTLILPKPGEGPTPRQQERGSFEILLSGRTAEGKHLRVRITGDRDPGYGSTAKMLGEAAACLALDVPSTAGGFWTPATIFGDRLIQRLTEFAGLTFDVLE
jgi:short subunit dehydrogenase-like uncharacterized protein